MLSDLVIWLAQKYQCVSVIGRNWARMDTLIRKAGPLSENIVPISLDYTDREKTVDAIRKSLWRNGPVGLMVAWVRSGHTDVITTIAEEVSSHSEEKWRLFHIRGSPSLSDRKIPSLPESALYREVILGFVIENDTSRWLTDEEIWHGVRDAIVSDEVFSTIGVIEPLDRMP